MMRPGLTQINVGAAVGTPQKVILEQLEWFGKDVMPQFKAQANVPVPADEGIGRSQIVGWR